jgi:hypothetical protein
MRVLIAFVTVVIIVVFTNSCNLYRHNNFNTYKDKPVLLLKDEPKTTGVYFLTNYSIKGYFESPIFFYLYKDGSVWGSNTVGLSTVPEQDFWKSPKAYLDKMNLNIAENSGHFLIRGNSIQIEVFAISPGSFFTKNVIRFEGQIKNDSTILLTKEICKWCSRHVREYPKTGIKDIYDEYKFYPTSIKPDSNKIWFKSKKWYKKSVGIR